MTGGGPVATQDHAFVLGCKGIGELLACRTNVNVLISHIAEVLLTEASFRLCVRGHRLWQHWLLSIARFKALFGPSSPDRCAARRHIAQEVLGRGLVADKPERPTINGSAVREKRVHGKLVACRDARN